MHILTALSTRPKALGVMMILIPAAQLPWENRAPQSCCFCGCADAFEDMDQSSTLPQPQGDPRQWDLCRSTSLGVEETEPRGSGGTRTGIKE